MMMAKKEASCMEQYVDIDCGVMLYVKDADDKDVPFSWVRHFGDIVITIDVKEMRRKIISEFIQKLNEGEEDDN